MVTITDGTTIAATGDGGETALTVSGSDAGRIRGNEVEVGELTVRVSVPGERSTRVLLAGRRPVLRMDSAGRKATWLVLSRSRFRLSRQMYRPFVRRWVLTRDVEGDPVLRVTQSPLGTRVRVVDLERLTEEERAALVAGVLVVVMDVPAEEVAGARGR
jgi:hypothetical protein